MPLIPSLETGQISSIEFWELLGESLERAGAGQAAPAWKFKGFWAGLLKDTIRLNQEVLGMIKRIRARVTVAGLSNVFEETALALYKMGAYDEFQPCLLSFKLGLRKP